MPMTKLMEHVIAKVSARPPEEQEYYATIFLDELKDERQWDEAFAAPDHPPRTHKSSATIAHPRRRHQQPGALVRGASSRTRFSRRWSSRARAARAASSASAISESVA